MRVSIRCPKCGLKFKAQPNDQGSRLRCPGCGQPFIFSTALTETSGQSDADRARVRKRWLISIMTNREDRWALIIVSAAVLSVGLAALVFGPFYMAFLLLVGGLIGVTIFLVAWNQTAHFFQTEVEKALKTEGHNFSIKGVTESQETPWYVRVHAAMAVYSTHYADAIRDGSPAKSDIHCLDRLAESLALPRRLKRFVETRQSCKLYRRLASAVLADSVITEEEGERLQAVRKRFGLTEQKAYSLNRSEVDRAYKRVFREVARQGLSLEDSERRLSAFRQATGLSSQRAVEITKQEARTLYAELVSRLLPQNGQITEEAKYALVAARQRFSISNREALKLNRREIKRAYRELLRWLRIARLPWTKVRKHIETFHEGVGLSGRQAFRLAGRSDRRLFLVKVRRQNGLIWSHVRQKWLAESPEELVRQQYLCALVNQYGFALNQIGEEVEVTGRGSGQARADLVIWKTAQDKASEHNPLIVIECKSDNVTIRPEDYGQGDNYARMTGARFLVTHNNRETKYWRVVHDRMPKSLEEIGDIPRADASDKEIQELVTAPDRGKGLSTGCGSC